MNMWHVFDLAQWKKCLFFVLYKTNGSAYKTYVPTAKAHTRNQARFLIARTLEGVCIIPPVWGQGWSPKAENGFRT